MLKLRVDTTQTYGRLQVKIKDEENNHEKFYY